MCVGSAIRELGRFLEECERTEGEVTDVDVARCTDAGQDVTARVELELPMAVAGQDDSPVSLRPDIDAEGRVQFAVETAGPVVPTTDYDVDVEPVDALLTEDGSVAIAFDAAVPTGSEIDSDDTIETPESAIDENRRQNRRRTADGNGTTVSTDADDSEFGVSSDTDSGSDTHTDSDPRPSRRSRDVPPFEDTELLCEVYETHDTFAEMAEALEMDVTAETVRRYMIDHDIHQPNSYDTGDDDEMESPPILADGIGLPEDVTVEGFIETVQRSNTIYEVTQEIGTDREDTLEMLRELNLLDLVTGRLAIESNREISHEEIIERLRESNRAR